MDFLLPVPQLAERIRSHIGHLTITQADGQAAALKEDPAQHITVIASILRNKTGHDFHGYKHNTFMRRIQRRLQVQQIDEIE